MSSSAKALTDFNSALADIASASAKNTAQSQDFAREQMAFQQASNREAMAHSSAEAQKNRDWQTQMSNTAHQREVKDLIAAGLNPVLSANAGASTPSGATGSGFSSSGASGQVDSSYVNAMASIFSQQLAMKNNIDIARINQETQLKTAEMGFDASLATANISAATQKQINNANIANQEYMAKYYPNTMYQAAGGIGSQLKDIWNGLTSGKKAGKAEKDLTKIASFLNSKIMPKRS